MSCTNCNPIGNTSYNDNPIINKRCFSQKNFGGNPGDSSDVIYNGPKLTCVDADSGSTLEEVLQKIDQKVCGVTGDFSSYDTHCLDNINNQQEFVESITDAYCTLKSDYDTFINTTLPGQLLVLDNKIDTALDPNVQETCVGLSDTSLEGILDYLISGHCFTLSEFDSIGDVNWSLVFNTPIVPTNLEEAFNTVINQIDLLNTSVENIDPESMEIDNTGSCLVGGTATDNLETTLTLIKNRLCQTSIVDIESLTWNCVSKPSGDNNDVQLVFETILGEIDTIRQRIPIFSDDFDISLDGCNGTNVSLGSLDIANNHVASTSSDDTPGTLQDKLQEGDNITLDYSTSPGKVIISTTGQGAASDGKVAAYNGDDDPQYLEDKLHATSGGLISAAISQDTGNKRLNLSINYDINALLQALLEELDSLPDNDPLVQLFCQIKSKCPGGCGEVTGLTVNYDN